MERYLLFIDLSGRCSENGDVGRFTDFYELKAVNMDKSEFHMGKLLCRVFYARYSTEKEITAIS